MNGPDEGRAARVLPLLPADPTRVGSYGLLGQLGQGGMGRVYLGRSPAGRLVAVKLVHEHLAEDPEFRRMFERETHLARRVARFCTAEVLDAGEHDGRPYQVTEYIDGPTLGQAVEAGGPLTGVSLERVAVATATALTAIHSAGLIHLDLKPSNVMLAASGPLVIDFGIAHALDSTDHLTRESAGTPAFMSPERAVGLPVGPPADVFAWGGVMIFTATGRLPFGKGSPDVVLYRVVHEAPDLTGVPEPLRSFVVEAMRSDPAHRPRAPQLLEWLLPSAVVPPQAPTAPTAMTTTHAAGTSPANAAVGVQRSPSLAGSPLSSSMTPSSGLASAPARVGAAPRPSRSRRRPKLLVALAALLALVLAAVASLALRTDDGPRDPGALAAPDVDALSRRLAGQAIDVRDDQPDLARRLAVTAYRTAPTSEASIGVYSVLVHRNPPDVTFSDIGAMAFGPDGALLATASDDGTLAITDEDAKAKLWDTAGRGSVDGPLATLVGHTDYVTGVGFSEVGGLVVTTSLDDTVRLWQASSRGTVAPFATFEGYDGNGGAVTLSPDGTRLAAMGQGGSVLLWDTTRPGDAPIVLDDVSVMAFSREGRLFATSTGHYETVLWDSTRSGTLTPVAEFASGSDPVTSVVFSPDGTLLATNTSGGTVRLWDVTRRGSVEQPLAILNAPGRYSGGGIAFSPDETLLATTGTVNGTQLFDTNERGTVAPVATLPSDTPSGIDLDFSPDGRLLATVTGGDRTVRLWDTSARGGAVAPVATLTATAVDVNQPFHPRVAFSPDGTQLVARFDQDRVASLWNVDVNQLVNKACEDPSARITAEEWAEYVPELPYRPPCG